MGKYVASSLLNGEHVVYEARLHWMIYFSSLLCFAISIFSFSSGKGSEPVGALLLMFGLMLFIVCMVIRKSTEFGVTNVRIIAKRGLISRHTVEMNIQKVEGVQVRQGILGRVFGYGTVFVIGTGGTKEKFKYIANPLELRKQVQNVISCHNVLQKTENEKVDSVTTSGQREIKMCPFCAEEINAAAIYCKHCRKDLS